MASVRGSFSEEPPPMQCPNEPRRLERDVNALPYFATGTARLDSDFGFPLDIGHGSSRFPFPSRSHDAKRDGGSLWRLSVGMDVWETPGKTLPSLSV